MLSTLSEILGAPTLAVSVTWLGVRSGPELIRRINRLFEAQKGEMARKFQSPVYLWGEYEFGVLSRFWSICRLFGATRLCWLLLQDPRYGRCENYNGAEKRFDRGTSRDRSMPDPNPAVHRIYDNPMVVSRNLLGAWAN